jgi:hypothetical protein
MALSKNKLQAKEQLLKVRQVLRDNWDLLGIGVLGGFGDEYDSYARKVYALLMDERNTSDDITMYLLDIAATDLGMDTPQIREECRTAANILVGLRPEFEAR